VFGKLKALLSSQKGATAVEYGLILALIFLAMVASIGQVATNTNKMWSNVSNKITNN